MTSATILLSIYGAALSSLLCLIQVQKYIRENRYIAIEATVSWLPRDDLWHEIWIMNQGGAPVTIRELEIGTFYRNSVTRRVQLDCSLSLLQTDDEGEPISIILGPGEAKRFSHSAVDVYLQHKEHLEFLESIGKREERSFIHGIEILHSRSSSYTFKQLTMKDFSLEDLAEMAARRAADPGKDSSK